MFRRFPLVMAALALMSCGDDGETTADTNTPDSTDTTDTIDTANTPDSTDTTEDVAPDTVPDTNTDPDTTPDVTPDTAPDVTPDVVPDTSPDVEPDAVPDVEPDTASEDAAEEIAANAPPSITAGPSGDVSAAVAGDTVALTVTATDLDGDTLTYAWTQVSPASAGVFGTPGSRTTSFSIPELAADTDFVLRVAVDDGVNPPVTADVTIAGRVPSFAADIQPIFAVCAGCHGDSGGMSLSAANAYTNLVNVQANNGACSSLKRVRPGTPDDSVLVRKISGTACGNRMPLSNPSYFVDDPGLVTRIRSWIAAGALNN